MTRTIQQASLFAGEVDLPGDKSIAHRAALLAAIGDGTSHIVGYPASADPQSTLRVLRALGVEIIAEEDMLTVHGRGLDGFTEPSVELDCGNSGTTMRLLSGILAGQPFASILTGDASLRSRPMGRIADPLREMKAEIELTDDHAPIRITGHDGLQPVDYRLPVASAQVKSCVLLAGLYAEGETSVIETTASRDHTERMLELDVVDFGGERHIHVTGGTPVAARTWRVPGDISAAAFFLVAGTLVPEGEVRIPGVGLNPSRAGVVDVLRTMGADITIENERTMGGEPLADLLVRPSTLHGVRIDGDLIPNLIDEIPVLALAATQAEGRTEIRDAGELRVKETDRIEAIATNLRALGAEVTTYRDGLSISGPQRLTGATVDSFDDHRIAMTMGVAGLLAEGETTVTGAEHARVSFPSFWDELDRLRG